VGNSSDVELGGFDDRPRRQAVVVTADTARGRQGSAHQGHQANQVARRFTPDQIRGTTFERAPFGRRGFDEQQVHAYLGQLAEVLAARDVEISRLAGENRQLKHALREWHRQLVGYDAVDLVARTQQQIEAQIAQAESYSREREIEAARLYDEMLAEARERAQAEVEREGQSRGVGDDESRHDPDAVRRQRVYTGALLQALDALAAQVDATRHAFSFEVEKLVDLTDSPPPISVVSTPVPPAPSVSPGPRLVDLTEAQQSEAGPAALAGGHPDPDDPGDPASA
jgi:DivIVA domain-containing protein